ncbi:hypothetical protein M3Y99_00511700 [Aphelenchoides fujianensis]|nr:hypothetical protein M3Y99_00511700 [Aphelenchoides fujianensis]
MDVPNDQQGECHVCGIQRTRFLSVHVAKHFDKKGGICSLCGIRENTNSARNRHERQVHGFHRTEIDVKIEGAVRIGPKTKEMLHHVGKNFDDVQRDAVQSADYDELSPADEDDEREENEDPTYEQLDGSSSGRTDTSFQRPPSAAKTPSTAGRKRASIAVLANQSNGQAAEDAGESPAPKRQFTRQSTLRSARADETNAEQRPAATKPNVQERKTEDEENAQQRSGFSQSIESSASEDSDGDEVKLEAGDRRASLVPSASSTPTQQSVAARVCTQLMKKTPHILYYDWEQFHAECDPMPISAWLLEDEARLLFLRLANPTDFHEADPSLARFFLFKFEVMHKKQPSGSHVVCFAKKNTNAIVNEFKLVLNERRTFQAIADAAFQLCARPELVDSALILAREADKKKIVAWAKGPFVVV